MSVLSLKLASSQEVISILKAIVVTLGKLFLILLIGLFFDSVFVSEIVPNNQLIANFVLLIIFILIYRKSTRRVKQLMVHAVIIGFIGEHLFSLGLGMYSYRLGNIPLYVPLGHAIVYLGPYFFNKKKAIQRNKVKLEKWFTIAILSYGTIFLLLFNDIFGFIMTIAVVLLLRRHPKERLYYLSMYVVVAFLEIIGTSYGCWSWPDIAFGKIPFLKSYNPPSGISLFYFLLDLGCLYLYKLRNKTAWKRMKNVRLLTVNSKS